MLRIISAIVIGMALVLTTHAADMEQGRTKAQVCTACHGANGVSISDAIPNLAGQKPTYIAKQLKAFREKKRENALMNALAAQLSDADIDNVAAFFSSLGSPGESEISDTGKAISQVSIAFPTDFKQTFTRYSISDQAGPKRVRHNYINKVGLQGPDTGGALADGTYVLTEIYAAKLGADGKPIKGDDGHYVADKLLAYAVMEKATGWGDIIPEELRNGNWHYALFTPEKKAKKINHAACLACHKPLSDADYLFSYDELMAKVK